MHTSEQTKPVVRMRQAALTALQRGDTVEDVRASLLAVAETEHISLEVAEQALEHAQAAFERKPKEEASTH